MREPGRGLEARFRGDVADGERGRSEQTLDPVEAFMLDGCANRLAAQLREAQFGQAARYAQMVGDDLRSHPFRRRCA